MYYKLDNNEILRGDTVEGPGYLLTQNNRGEHTYPVDGWYWFDSDADMLEKLPRQTHFRRLTRLQFRNRFTQAEKVAIYEAATSSAAIRVWLDDLAVSTPEADGTSVDLDDPYCIAGVEAICGFLETAQVITDGAARAAEILA